MTLGKGPALVPQYESWREGGGPFPISVTVVCMPTSPPNKSNRWNTACKLDVCTPFLLKKGQNPRVGQVTLQWASDIYGKYHVLCFMYSLSIWPGTSKGFADQANSTFTTYFGMPSCVALITVRICQKFIHFVLVCVHHSYKDLIFIWFFLSPPYNYCDSVHNFIQPPAFFPLWMLSQQSLKLWSKKYRFIPVTF